MPVEAPVTVPPPKSPFQKPSVQIISLSDDGSEAPTTVRYLFTALLSWCIRGDHAAVINTCGNRAAINDHCGLHRMCATL